jgi:hypothetical protein
MEERERCYSFILSLTPHETCNVTFTKSHGNSKMEVDFCSLLHSNISISFVDCSICISRANCDQRFSITGENAQWVRKLTLCTLCIEYAYTNNTYKPPVLNSQRVAEAFGIFFRDALVLPQTTRVKFPKGCRGIWDILPRCFPKRS